MRLFRSQLRKKIVTLNFDFLSSKDRLMVEKHYLCYIYSLTKIQYGGHKNNKVGYRCQKNQKVQRKIVNGRIRLAVAVNKKLQTFIKFFYKMPTIFQFSEKLNSSFLHDNLITPVYIFNFYTETDWVRYSATFFLFNQNCISYRFYLLLPGTPYTLFMLTEFTAYKKKTTF